MPRIVHNASMRADIAAERARLRAEYGDLYDECTAILFRHDPVRTRSPVPDEYEGEARRIVPRLAGCQSVDDVRRVVHEAHVYRFSVTLAGPEERYADAAADIWQAWGSRGQ